MAALQTSWIAPPPRIAFAISPLHLDRFLPSPTKGRRRSSAIRAEASGGPPRPVKGKLTRQRTLWRKAFRASRKVRSAVLLNVITVIYASDIPVVKEIEEIVDPALFNMIRFILCAIPFVPFIYQNKGDHRIRSNGVELGCWLGLGYISQALGLLTSEAGRASFLSAFTVILVPLIDGIFGATLPPITWIGAILSLIGVALLECGGSPPSVGDLLNLLSALFFGIHIYRMEHISRTTEKRKVFALLGYQVSVVVLFSAIWCFSSGVLADTVIPSSVSQKWATAWDWIVCFPWIPALYTGVFSTGLCLWAEMVAMCDVSATETAIIYGLEPLWGASFSWFLLGERWTATGWLGAALILGGSLAVQIFGAAPEKPKGDQGCSEDSYQLNEKPNDLSLSTVIICPEENSRNIVKKDEG